jgi:myo-inositol-1-phosphate synthase
MTIQVRSIQSSQEYDDMALEGAAIEELQEEDTTEQTVERIVRPYREIWERQTEALDTLSRQYDEHIKIQRIDIEELRKRNEESRKTTRVLQQAKELLITYKNALDEKNKDSSIQQPKTKESESCYIFHAIASMVVKIWSYFFCATEEV